MLLDMFMKLKHLWRIVKKLNNRDIKQKETRK